MSMPVPLLNTTVDTPAIEASDVPLIAGPSLLPGPSLSSEPAANIGHGDSEGTTGPLSMAGNVAVAQSVSGATSAGHSQIAPAGEPGDTNIGSAPPEATVNDGTLANTLRDGPSSSMGTAAHDTTVDMATESGSSTIAVTVVPSSKKGPARSQIFQPGLKETAR